MDTNEKLRQFMERMQRIRPPYGSLAHNGIPSMGESNVAAERTQEMQRLAVYFARSYQSKTATLEDVRIRAEELEAVIMTVATYGVMDASQTDELLDAMQELIQHRGE